MRNILYLLVLAAVMASCNNNADSAAPPVESAEETSGSLASTPALTGPVADLSAEWDSTASQVGAFLKELRLSQVNLVNSLNNQEAKAKLNAADRKKATQLETELQRLGAIYTELNGAFNTWSEGWQQKAGELSNLKTMKPADPLPESVATTIASLQEEIQKSRSLLSEWQTKFQKVKSQIDEKKRQYDALINQENG